MSDLINNLIGYVNDIKPFHTKIFGVGIGYISSDAVDVTVSEDVLMHVNLGLPVSSMLESMAIAVGDDDGWDTASFDSTPFDVIISDSEGFTIDGDIHVSPTDLDWDAASTYQFDGNRYRKLTSVMDYAFVTINEDLQIEGEIVGTKTDAMYTQAFRLWDDPATGIHVTKVGTNYLQVDNDLTNIFEVVSTINVYGSSLSNGMYTITNAVYNSTTNETTIYVEENGLSQNDVGAIIYIGLYDAFEWDGNAVTNVPQPTSHMSTNTNICESLVVSQGIGWDDSDKPWDATIDVDYAAPEGEFHNAIHFSNPSKWDDATHLINSSSSNHITNRERGWDIAGFEVDVWDQPEIGTTQFYNQPTSPDLGSVVFSSYRLPQTNPTRSNDTFNQFVASASWVISHNLGYYPIIRVFNTNGEEIEPLSVTHPSINQTVINFSSAQIGSVRIL